MNIIETGTNTIDPFLRQGNETPLDYLWPGNLPSPNPAYKD